MPLGADTVARGEAVDDGLSGSAELRPGSGSGAVGSAVRPAGGGVVGRERCARSGAPAAPLAPGTSPAPAHPGRHGTTTIFRPLPAANCSSARGYCASGSRSLMSSSGSSTSAANSSAARS